MLASVICTAVDTAAGDNGHITVVADIKIIVNSLFQTCLGEHYRNMNAFIFCSRFDLDDNAVSAFSWQDLNMFCAVSCLCLAVGTDIIGSYRDLMESGNRL